MRPPPLTVNGVTPITQRDGRPVQQQQPPRKEAGSQLPVERVAEGDVLEKRTLLNADASSFHTTGRYHTTSEFASGGGGGFTQRAITEYQSLALMGKGRFMPLHRVDEYV